MAAVVTFDQLQGFGLVMGIFMLFASPFAAILLLSWVRERLSARRRVKYFIQIMFVIPAALALLSLFLFFSLRSDYLKFVEKSTDYHAQFAEACERLRKANPLGSNEILSVSISAEATPRIITQLHPSEITVVPDGIRISFHKGDRNAYYSVGWMRDAAPLTNVWRLDAGGGEAPYQVVYSVTNLLR
jgi:hypothetical protein